MRFRGSDENGSEIDCWDCAELINRQVSETGGLELRGWHYSPVERTDADIAMHEAAHAVAAVRAEGIRVTEAYIGTESLSYGVSEGISGGRVNFHVDSASLEAVANMSHAGWAADRMWLRAIGRAEDPALQIDAACASAGDMKGLTDMAAPHGWDVPQLHTQAIAATDELVGEHEAEIRAVHEELLRHRHLGPEAIHAAMDLAHRPRRTQQSRPDAEPPTGGAGTTTNMPAAAAGATSTPSTGGTGMSLIDQARTTLAGTNERANYILGALRQAQLDLEANATEVSGVSADAMTPLEIGAVYRQAMEQIEQVMGLVSQATESTEAYAASLHS
ncbi:hypothetical protein [Saccharopolyspora endophytica]|uniref:Uncharacterized protein n=1 Tax=Saccharopolyspora endophytica TaxID=543886 RepID=A0ABS5DEA9_9PSEU|nr:hypothetical protein [Saccharopolyspora endophytica]MBQ0924614.1 hypothetical protein [Saccharopolyspora endophytica]